MSNRLELLVLVAWFVVSNGCGGAGPSDGAAQPVSPADRPKSESLLTLSRADLTTAVDESSMTATAPTSTEFLPDTKEIYFIGTIEGLPAETKIEVHWYLESKREPLHVSQDVGSGTHTVLSRFRPAEDRFAINQYQVVVYAETTEVGLVSFRIADQQSGGRVRVKELSVTPAVEVRTNRALRPISSFHKGTKRVFATFYVSGLESGGTIRLLWHHDEELVREDDLECEGEKRYAVAFENRKRLARGDWGVDVEVRGEVFASRTFFVGDTGGGPAIDRAALGAKAGRMPGRGKTVFKADSKVIHCGIRFLHASEDSKIEVRWISLGDDGEELVHTSSSKVNKDGKSTVGVTWKPDAALSPGPYKATIVVNTRKLEELAFTVE